MNSPVISVENLVKRYGGFTAVDGISFAVGKGEIFGLLGPNGAGKTTTLEILEGLRDRDGGAVSVLGLDPRAESRRLRDRIGVSLQATALPGKLKVREALAIFGRLYSRRADPDALLDKLQLREKAEGFFADLSGGQKQRLALALALVNEPEIVFLDEPTTGLDPQVRREIHGLIESLRAGGRTVIVTTHYIEEAERLCDRVAIIDRGRIVALDTPRELQKRHVREGLIEIHLAAPLPDGLVPEIAGATVARIGEGNGFRITSDRPAQALVEAVQWLTARGATIADLNLKRATLEDAFIELTGRSLRD